MHQKNACLMICHNVNKTEVQIDILNSVLKDLIEKPLLLDKHSGLELISRKKCFKKFANGFQIVWSCWFWNVKTEDLWLGSFWVNPTKWHKKTLKNWILRGRKSKKYFISWKKSMHFDYSLTPKMIVCKFFLWDNWTHKKS